MMGNHFSIILLPINKCNVACEYCFEDKTDDRMSLDQLRVVLTKVFDHLDEAAIRALTIHWQGGEIMLIPPDWFARAFELIQNLAAKRGKFVERPARIISHDCIDCDYLAMCHGGCPVRTYTFRGSMFEKDPYCEVYLAMFRKAEEAAAKLSATRAFRPIPPQLVQIERGAS